jgi:hypothetical protein
VAVSLSIGKKEYWPGVGPWPDVTLEKARETAADYRKLLKQGINPLVYKREVKSANEKAAREQKTVRECAAEYIEDKRDDTKDKTIENWKANFRLYINPVIGDMLSMRKYLSLIIKVFFVPFTRIPRLIPLVGVILWRPATSAGAHIASSISPPPGSPRTRFRRSAPTCRGANAPDYFRSPRLSMSDAVPVVTSAPDCPSFAMVRGMVGGRHD